MIIAKKQIHIFMINFFLYFKNKFVKRLKKLNKNLLSLNIHAIIFEINDPKFSEKIYKEISIYLVIILF